jgi:RHS repeat-associated protein
MARQPRIEYPGSIYHVISRRIGRQYYMKSGPSPISPAGLLYPNPIPTSGYVGTFYYHCVSGGSSYFADVAPTNAFCPAVNYIASQNITGGCDNVPDYCPSGTVLESQMILFLHAAWPSFLYVPRGTIYTFRNSSDRLATEMTGTAGSISCVNTSTAPDFPVATTPTRDNTFLGNLLVASYDSSALGGTVGWTYYHSDHLGTPRYITGVEGPFSPKYWPYGEEVTQNTTSQKLRFATMERDLEVNRFFDHARSHDFNLGRFVGVDKHSGSPEDPQTWNRYSYANDNPLKFVDPNGHEVIEAGVSLVAFGVAATAALAAYYVNRFTLMLQGTHSVPEFMNQVQTSTLINMSIAPSVTFPGWDPNVAPGEGFGWRGTGDPASGEGNYIKPGSKERWRPDFQHADPIGPHWDYTDPQGRDWRVFPDGRVEPKKGEKKKDEGSKSNKTQIMTGPCNGALSNCFQNNQPQPTSTDWLGQLPVY